MRIRNACHIPLRASRCRAGVIRRVELRVLVIGNQLQRLTQSVNVALALGLRLGERLLKLRHAVDRVLQRVHVGFAFGLRLDKGILQCRDRRNALRQCVGIALAFGDGLEIHLLQGRYFHNGLGHFISGYDCQLVVAGNHDRVLAIGKPLHHVGQLVGIGLALPDGVQQDVLDLLTALVGEQVAHTVHDVRKILLRLQRLNIDLCGDLLRGHQQT